MKQAIFSHLITLIVGIIAGIALINLFDGGFYSPSPSVVHIEPPSVTAARIAAAEYRFRSKMDSLFFANIQLQDQVEKTQSTLKQAKEKNRRMEKAVEEMILYNDTATDTTLLLDNCDSLSGAVEDLLLLNTIKDSLYESAATDLQWQITGKDSIIALQQQQYDTLKFSFDKTLLQQQELITSNQQYSRQLKKQKKGKRWLSAVLVFLGGLTTYSAVK